MPLVYSTSQDPQTFLARIVENRLTVRVEDIELLAEEQKTRILERTAAGTDVEGKAFAPYSTKGPYYYYPQGKATTIRGKTTRNRIAARRFHSAINAGRSTPVGEVTRGGAVKFASYAEFKKALGRTTVDLLGPKAPHMLQMITKRITGPLEVRLGIYDSEKAAIGSGHNQGNAARHLPRRRWFGISDSDREAIKERLAEILRQRSAA